MHLRRCGPFASASSAWRTASRMPQMLSTDAQHASAGHELSSTIAHGQSVKPSDGTTTRKIATSCKRLRTTTVHVPGIVRTRQGIFEKASTSDHTTEDYWCTGEDHTVYSSQYVADHKPFDKATRAAGKVYQGTGRVGYKVQQAIDEATRAQIVCPTVVSRSESDLLPTTSAKDEGHRKQPIVLKSHNENDTQATSKHAVMMSAPLAEGVAQSHQTSIREAHDLQPNRVSRLKPLNGSKQISSMPDQSRLRFASSASMQSPHPGFCAANPPVVVQHFTLSSGEVDVQCADSEASSPSPNTGSGKNHGPGNGGEGSPKNGSASGNMPASLSQSSRNMQNSENSHDSDQNYESSDSNDESDSEAEVEYEEHTPLSFQIPADALRTAMQASEQSMARFYNYKLYRGPEGQKISVHYCTTIELAERVAKYFLDESVVGFDIEWKPWASRDSIKDNASLIQLACEDRIALFHISLFRGNTAEQLVPESLRTVLESPNILKVGVNIKGDFTRLKDFLGIQASGKYELSRLYNVVEYTKTNPSKVNAKLVALARQVHQHLLLPLYKGEVRESDWSSKKLTEEQCVYAAIDAYAGFRLYDALEAKRKLIRPIPPRPPPTDSDIQRKRVSPQEKQSGKAAKSTVAAGEEAIEDEMEDEGEQYDTAPEELTETGEDETQSLSNLSTNSKSSKDPNADYVPPTRRMRRVPDGSTEQPGPSTNHVATLDSGAFTDHDLGYPVLPRRAAADEADFAAVEIERAIAAEYEAKRKTSSLSPEDRSVFAPLSQNTLGLAVENDDYVVDSDEEEAMVALLSRLEIEEAKGQPIESVLPAGGNKPNAPYRSPLSGAGSVVEQHPNSEATKEATAPAQKDLSNSRVNTKAQDQDFEESLTSQKPAATTPRTPEWALADMWATSYQASTIPSPSLASTTTSRVRATLPHLRAYHLWHHQCLPLPDIATHLRDPPLSINTVAGYVLQAVTLEKLDYKREALRDVLKVLPIGVRMGRFRWLVERVGGLGSS